MKKILAVSSLVSLGALSFTAQAVNQALFEKGTGMTVNSSSKVAVSQAVRDIASPIRRVTKQRKIKLQQSGDGVPGVDYNKEVNNIFPFASNLRTQPKVDDPSIQSVLKPNLKSLAAPTAGVSFDGIDNILGVAPPDTNGDVGPNHYVQAVNVSLAVYDKEGNTLVEPFAINDLWDGFGGQCETNNDGDPIILYDEMADRWLISQFALDGTDNHECVAISTTGDPTGSYYLYDFPYGELMNDYPHLGVWHDGYYMGVNQFDPNNNFAWSGGGVVAYERDKMLIGAEAKQVIFNMQGNDPEVFTPMPLDMDGALAPSPETNQIFMWADADGPSRLHFWEFDVDWENAENSTFTARAAIDVAPWNGPENAVQPNGIELDGMPIRSMFRAAYRNLGHRSSIVFTHNVAGSDNSTPALRWYEIDLDETSGDVSVRQQGTFAPDENARWMGSGAMDVQGNMAFGYSVSGENKHPSIFAATRLVTDPLNELTSEIELKAGEGSQGNVNRNRWGDYSSMSIDPADGCTFWFTTEYYKAEDTGTLAWSTNISSFKLPECTSGPSGQITGRIMDSETGEPIERAMISTAGRSTLTDEEGNYTLTVPVGDYSLQIYKYGWRALTTAEFSVTEGEIEGLDATLAVADKVTVTGGVNDGSGQDWPLYAKVNVEVPGEVISTYTNPETGIYSVELVAGTAVKFNVASETTGYLNSTEDVTPVASDTANFSQSFALNVDPNCTAQGYRFDEPGFYEGFEAETFPPQGWTVEDATGNGGWERSSRAALVGISGESEGFAYIDSDALGSVNVDTSLVSPVLTTAEFSNLNLRFKALHRTFTTADKLELDVKVNGGEWTNITELNKGRGSTTPAENYEFDIESYVSGSESFQLRWRYYDANYEWYAAVDDVLLGTPSCLAVDGEKVTAYIHDANLETPVNGAALVADGVTLATSKMTDEDSQAQDGLLTGFIPDGVTTVELMASGFENKEVTSSDFSLSSPIMLNAGLLQSASDNEVEMNITVGRDEEKTITLDNVGTAGANYRVLMIPGSTEPSQAAVFDASGRHFGPKNLQDLTTLKARYAADIQTNEMAGGDLVGSFNLDQGFGWGLVMDRNTGNLWVSDIVVGGAEANQLVEYEIDGTKTGRTLPAELGGAFGADLAFNGRTSTYWQVNVGGDNCVHELNSQGGLTGASICPEFAQSQRGLAYDPKTDTFYSGSWNDSLIHQFTPSGELLRSVNVNLAIAGLAFNSATGKLYVTHNGAAETGIFDVYVIDTDTDFLDIVGGFNVGDEEVNLQGQAGLEIDCDGNLWAVDQTQQKVIGVATHETGVCDWKSIPWLTLSGEPAGSVAAGDSGDLALTLRASELVTGDHAATLVVLNDTPYGALNIPLTVTVNDSATGSLGFKETAVSAKNGDIIELMVSRSDGDDFAASVDYEVIASSAVSGEHFTLENGSLGWADKDGADKSISVQTTNLDLDEDVNFTVRLLNASGASLNDANKDSLVTITADQVGVVAVKAANVSVNEEDGTADIVLTRTEGTDREVSVNYQVNHISTDDADLGDMTGTVTWADGDAEEKTVSITINDDADVEADEAFNLVISAAADSGVQVGASVAAVQVLNADAAPAPAPDPEPEPAKKKSSGSLGFLGLAALGLFGLRRRKLAS